MKTAIITGAAGSLGQGVVKKFLEDGYLVAGTINHDKPGKEAEKDPQFEQYVVDLMDEKRSSQFVESVVSKYNTIDVAVLTVGGFAMGKIADTKTSDIVKQCRLNFETAYNVARPVFNQMMKQNTGRIFLIGSRPGLDMRNAKGMVAYSLAKSLIFRLAELMNDEAKGHDVITSVIVPSTIDTADNRKAMPDAKYENWVKPEQIADVILSYCTPAAGLVKEPVIKVYGNA
jgi:NAD(P)-dependent dehydrogenase (short-subunit alcohol dehydrogenase family)